MWVILTFYYSLTLVLFLPSCLAHPRFYMDTYSTELYREASPRLWVMRTRLFRSERGICDSRFDGIAHLDIVWGLHYEK